MFIYSNDQSDNSQLSGPYAELCRFITLLNAHETEIKASPLQRLFTETINQHALLEELKNKPAVEVLFPGGGEDPVPAFLFDNVTQATVINTNYFFDPGTELTQEAWRSLTELLRVYVAEGYSCRDDYDIANPACFHEGSIKINATTTYNHSLEQSGYFLLLRLKIYLGAKLETVALIDPMHPDLGFVINFCDQKGNKKVLKYFQKSLCTENAIITYGGHAEGADPETRKAAIEKNIANTDVVIFKKEDKFSLSSGARSLLDMLQSNTKIVCYKPPGYSSLSEGIAIILNMSDYKNIINFNKNPS